MGSSGRPLLFQGNEKVGEAIHRFDLPAVLSCPGRSPDCERVCYATKGRYHFAKVKDRLQWCYEQSMRSDFAELMAAEVRRRGVLVLRIHCSGDFYDADYARKWLSVMRLFPRVRFYFYSRSWRVPEIAGVLEQMAELRCCRAWFSIDKGTGVPGHVPAGVRLAYLQTDDMEHPSESDLVFRVRKLRTLASLPIICGAETPEGKRDGVTCGSCARCFQ